MTFLSVSLATVCPFFADKIGVVDGLIGDESLQTTPGFTPEWSACGVPTGIDVESVVVVVAVLSATGQSASDVVLVESTATEVVDNPETTKVVVFVECALEVGQVAGAVVVILLRVEGGVIAVVIVVVVIVVVVVVVVDEGSEVVGRSILPST